MEPRNKLHYYPCECSIINYEDYKNFVCNDESSETINDRNCICFPIICSIGIIFDIVTCIPFSFYSSYQKCKKCTKCYVQKNKVSVAIIKHHSLNDSLPSYEFTINNTNEINNTITQIVLDRPPSYYYIY